jgi:HD-GYP domain-containing protein (c-di-GMP phosphodiesterase class II)
MKMADIIGLRNGKQPRKHIFPRHYLNGKSDEHSISMRMLVADNKLSLEEKSQKAEKIYNDSLDGIKLIFNRANVDFSILPSPGALDLLVKSIVSELRLNNIEFMDFFMRHEEGDYLPSHSVNVTFLSVMIGVWLNYNMSGLESLAKAAILHDIGMLEFIDIVSKQGRLSPQEREQVSGHPNLSCEFVRRIPGFSENIARTVLMHHKRFNHKDDNIDEHAQIIGLADVLEAMTHPRAYKSAMQPHTAVRSIIENMKAHFSQPVIKALVDNIGLYPPGTWVILDTDEIGLVIDTNYGSPLSPKVSIMFDSDMKRFSQTRIYDLSKKTNIHIVGPIEDEKKCKFKKKITS